MLENIFKKNKIKMRFSAQVFVMGAIFSVTFFLLLLDTFKTYQSQISILVSAKSQVAAAQQENLLENVLELPKTLLFYDTVLRQNPDVRDVTREFSPDKRKAKWNQMLTVKKANKKASVIEISIIAKNQNDAEQLSKKTVRTLLNTIGAYYDVKKDVDLRIIDGPISTAKLNNWGWLLLASLILGFGIAQILQKFLFENKNKSFSQMNFFKNKSFFDFKKDSKMPAEKELETLKNLYQNKQAEESFVFEQEIRSDEIEKIEEMKKLTQQMEQDKYPNFPEMPIREGGKAGAPENLPIADENFFAENFSQEQISKEESVPVETQQKPEDKEVKEPTPEELKERLNQLLKGKL